MQIIKKEYIYRIENPEKSPDFNFPISEITNQIERATKITLGELYLILEKISNSDIEFSLIDNPDEPEDKKIKFFPFCDANINFSLANFRPEQYSTFRIFVTKNFLKALKSKREKRSLFQLKKGIPDRTENQKSILELLNNLYKFYPLYSEQINKVLNTQKLIKQLDTWMKAIEKIKISN